MLRIASLEPYGARSHLAFLEGLRRSSRHELVLFTLPARAWKWRMRTAALHFAELLRESSEAWDLLLVSDYLAVAELRALLPAHLREIPIVGLFHENQLTYPLQEGEARDNQYALTHLYSLLSSQRSVFFSEYHRTSLFAAFPKLLRHAPDVAWKPWLEQAFERTAVLPIGTDAPLGRSAEPVAEPLLLWNHRWEYDKDPGGFVDAVSALDAVDPGFRVRILGERFRVGSKARARLAATLGPRLEDMGFLEDRPRYLDALAGAHVHVSTARHEFFGVGSLEALRAGLLPVWPRDLAYPELLPPGLRRDPRFAYVRGEGLLHALRGALEAARTGAWSEDRAQLRQHAGEYDWRVVAPRYDALFEGL